MQGHWIPTQGASWMGSRRYVGPTYNPMKLDGVLYLIDTSTNKVYERNNAGAPGKLLGKLITETGQKKIVPLNYGLRTINLNENQKNNIVDTDSILQKLKDEMHTILEEQFTKYKNEIETKQFDFVMPTRKQLGGVDDTDIIYLQAMFPSAKRYFSSIHQQFNMKKFLEIYLVEIEPYYIRLREEWGMFQKIQAERMAREKEETETKAVRNEQERIRKLYESIEPFSNGRS